MAAARARARAHAARHAAVVSGSAIMMTVPRAVTTLRHRSPRTLLQRGCPTLLRRGFATTTTRSGPSPDSHITICPTFTVPDGKLSAFTDAFPAFYAATKAGTDKCLYYGFAISDNHVFCREGYADAEGCLAHVGDVGEPLGAAVAMVGEGGLDLSVMGPAEELDKLREAFGPLGARFWETDGGSMWWG
jgi:hypothetical protein